MATGTVLPDQASVICTAVDALPDDTADPAVQEECERHLIGLAAEHDAKKLRILGRKVLEVIDPDLADAHEAAILEKQEREAAKAASFSMWQDGHGSWHGKFTMPDLEGAALRKALLAGAAPKHLRATGETYDHQRPSTEKLGRAFCEYVLRCPKGKLPQAGGLNATLIVTIPLETLEGRLKAAHIDTGEAISPGRSRMLACEAGLIPVVLGSKSQALDQGRKTRFQTEVQRIALTVEQKHCQHGLGPNNPTGNCDVPASMCHVHHKTFWSRGGKTSIRDAELLCPRHHTLAHRNPPMRT